MKFLIMPDSFKESLSAQEVAEIIKSGIAEAMPDAYFDLAPVGDGGEGTLDALRKSMSLTEHIYEVAGYDRKPASMRYATYKNQAFFEMADLVGLQKIPVDKRKPLEISTQGLGELIIYLQTQGFEKIYMGVGGSGTVDGGIGLGAGLGYRFYDKNGNIVKPLGKNLEQVATIDDTRVPEITAQIFAVTDVRNPLCGENGASYVFGPQKGLPDDELETVDQALHSFYQTFYPDILHVPGAGAGGGISAGVVAFAKAEIIDGIDFVLDMLDFEKRVASADYIIVGEGRMDSQSIEGKAPIGIARRAPKETPVIAICGSLEKESLHFKDQGITAVFPIIGQPGSLADVLANAKGNLRRTAFNIASLLQSKG